MGNPLRTESLLFKFPSIVQLRTTPKVNGIAAMSGIANTRVFYNYGPSLGLIK